MKVDRPERAEQSSAKTRFKLPASDGCRNNEAGFAVAPSPTFEEPHGRRRIQSWQARPRQDLRQRRNSKSRREDRHGRAGARADRAPRQRHPGCREPRLMPGPRRLDEKRERIDREAKAVIEAERAEREAKTAKLRELRLARQ